MSTPEGDGKVSNPRDSCRGGKGSGEETGDSDSSNPMGEETGRRGAGWLVDTHGAMVLESVMSARNESMAVGNPSGAEVEKCICSGVDNGTSILGNTSVQSSTLGIGTTI